MQLNRGSTLVKWTYVLATFGPPRQTTLCRFFWRCFVFMPLFWLFIGIVVAGGIVGLVLGTIETRGGLLAVLGFLLGGIWAFASGKVAGVATTISRTIEPSVFVQGLKAIKGKFCPIIRIVDEE